MWPEILLPSLLAAQGIFGGLDTLLNHELMERLPYRAEARDEIGLHALRETAYACLFLGIAWFDWHGAAAGVPIFLVAAEIYVTTCDELVENKIRVLPLNERLLHVFLTLNLGAIATVLTLTVSEWGSHSTGLVFSNHGALSIVLTLLGLAAAAWALRDAMAWRRLNATPRSTTRLR
jgi:hypothetical protein